MATVITAECINCGACEAECPNTAIYQGGVEWERNGVKHPAIAQDIFYIVPEKCTECVGFFDHEACAAVCPVDCCIPDPQIPESEEVLLERARVLHPDRLFADAAPSRFKKAGATPAPTNRVAEPTAAPAASATPQATPAARETSAVVPAVREEPKTTEAGAAPALTASGADTEAAAVPEPPAAATASPTPGATPAAPQEPATVLAVTTPPAPTEEGAVPVPAAGVAAAVPLSSSRPAAKSGAAAPPPTAAAEKPAATWADTPVVPAHPEEQAAELPGTFEDALARLGRPGRGINPRLKLAIALAQPLLGGLPAGQKMAVEDAIGDPRSFTAAAATAANAVLNGILYPLIIGVAGLITMPPATFRQQLATLLGVGAGVAVLETILRFREVALRNGSFERLVYRGALYALPLARVLTRFTDAVLPATVRGGVPVDGFHGGIFGEKTERERRYGEVYALREQGNGYLLRLELPRTVPPSAIKEQLGVADAMPPYACAVSLRNAHCIVRASVSDPKVRKIAAVSPAFPPDFRTTIELPARVTAFKHRIRDQVLEVVLLKG